MFLILPVGATLCNVFLAAFFFMGLTPRADAQPALHLQEPGAIDRCIGVTGEDCKNAPSLYDDLTSDETGATDSVTEDDEEEDPMLQEVPGYENFKAYVRADVSTFYGEEPGSRAEYEPSYQGVAAKFVNMSPDTVELYWVGENPVLIQVIQPWSSGGTASFPGHKFIFAKPRHPDQVICRFEVQKGTSVRFCDPFTPNDSSDPARGEYELDMMSLDSLSDYDRSFYDAHIFNLKFGAEYKNFTGGSEWLSMYPRNRPRHKIWRADYFGQEHVVTTTETHFVKIPETRKLETAELGKEYDPLPEYREPGTLNMTIKALSCAPRAFEIRDFLSDIEADHILDVVKRFHLARSTTGGHQSDTRTSKTTWIPRFTDPVLNAVFRRVADALRMNEALLRYRLPDEFDGQLEKELKLRPINEDLQIVHYDVGQGK